MKRFALWLVTIFLASAGGAMLHSGWKATFNSELPIFAGLFCLLSALVIYRQQLRDR